MRLSFNVLWVEDQPAMVAPQARAIAARMEEQGFEFDPAYCKSLHEVRARVADEVFKDDVDLILVDWDLGGDVQGQNVIREIRDSIHFKDVIFYSAMTSVSDLRALARNADLEGTYCVTRQDLVHEVMGIFESLVKKVLDLDHTRGIVMGATCDIDHMVEEALTTIDQLMDDSGKEKLLKKTVRLVEDRMKGLDATLVHLKAAGSMAEVLKAHALVTAHDRLRVLLHALKDAKLRKHKDYSGAVNQYLQQIVPHRNILGHSVLTPDGKPVGVQDSKGRQISVEETRKLRRLLLTLRKDFRKLLDALRGEAGA